MESLSNYQVSNPLVDIDSFPATVASQHWSSSTKAVNTAGAWDVNFGAGYMILFTRTNNYYIRCVAGGNASASAYSDNGDGKEGRRPS